MYAAHGNLSEKVDQDLKSEKRIEMVQIDEGLNAPEQENQSKYSVYQPFASAALRMYMKETKDAGKLNVDKYSEKDESFSLPGQNEGDDFNFQLIPNQLYRIHYIKKQPPM
ncbi:MAG: hypothetical protein EZS28_001945 [Streblomastix strix]|uniref:Uncharacterized protein n=1 Tax=Streblomastix strix TaxID=222440 RepID=A0A5J4X5L0_9EUKA|nr:MAG: hypothetical protein EZS28_001945 [Streblomastix strix]